MKKILLVDDDALVARIYREKLSEEGFSVNVAEDGVLAMKLLVEHRPDLVILDLLMPKMNGADVLKFIRERPELKSTGVIVFSNSFLAAIADGVGTLKVEAVLPKSSATPSRLIELIHQVLAAVPAAPVPSSGEKKEQRTKLQPIKLQQIKVQPIKVQPIKVQPIKEVRTKPAAVTERAPVTERRPETGGQEFRTRVQQEFVKHLPRVLADIRQLSRNLLDARDPKSELRALDDASRKVGFLTQMASMAGSEELAQLSSALELLFFHLQDKKAPVGDSCCNTIASTVAFLTQHLEKFDPALAGKPLSAPILVVDDDPASIRGIVHALTHANLLCKSVNGSIEALELLKKTSYGLILLDIELPMMNGMELCENIRGLDLHRRTPVVFITSHTDLKTRARSILSGGNDFICKPILPIELTVKVITRLLESRAS